MQIALSLPLLVLRPIVVLVQPLVMLQLLVRGCGCGCGFSGPPLPDHACHASTVSVVLMVGLVLVLLQQWMRGPVWHYAVEMLYRLSMRPMEMMHVLVCGCAASAALAAAAAAATHAACLRRHGV